MACHVSTLVFFTPSPWEVLFGCGPAALRHAPPLLASQRLASHLQASHLQSRAGHRRSRKHGSTGFVEKIPCHSMASNTSSGCFDVVLPRFAHSASLSIGQIRVVALRGKRSHAAALRACGFSRSSAKTARHPDQMAGLHSPNYQFVARQLKNPARPHPEPRGANASGVRDLLRCCLA